MYSKGFWSCIALLLLIHGTYYLVECCVNVFEHDSLYLLSGSWNVWMNEFCWLSSAAVLHNHRCLLPTFAPLIHITDMKLVCVQRSHRYCICDLSTALYTSNNYPVNNTSTYYLEFRNYIDIYFIFLFFLDFFKGIVHPKMKILSVFTHPHVVPTP